jgi:hypothetical protein
MCVLHISPNLEKHPPFPQFSSKLSEIVLQIGFFLQDQSFGESTFLARMPHLKNG